MQPGSIILTEDGRFGVILEARSGYYKIVTPNEDDEPEFSRCQTPTVIHSINDSALLSTLEQYAEIARVMARVHFSPMEKARDLTKLVKRIKTTKDGVRRTYWVRPGAFEKLGSKKKAQQKPEAKKQSETYARESKAWYQHLLPPRDSYQAAQAGNAEVLAQHLYNTFFYRNPETHEVLTQRITASMPRARVEGFEVEDLVQETIFEMLRMQSLGRLNDVPHEKFPQFFTATFKNIGRTMVRRVSKEERNSGGWGSKLAQDVSDFANMVADGAGATPEEAYIAQESGAKVKADFQEIHDHILNVIRKNRKSGYSARNEQIWHAYMIQGKQPEQISNELGVTSNAIKQVVKRFMPEVQKVMREKGYSDRTHHEFRTASIFLFGHESSAPAAGYKAAAVKFELTADGRLLMKGFKDITKLAKKTITNKLGHKQTVYTGKGTEDPAGGGKPKKSGGGRLAQIKDSIKSAVKKVLGMSSGSSAGGGSKEAAIGAMQEGRDKAGKSAVRGLGDAIASTLAGKDATSDVSRGLHGVESGVKQSGEGERKLNELNQQKTQPKPQDDPSKKS